MSSRSLTAHEVVVVWTWQERPSGHLPQQPVALKVQLRTSLWPAQTQGHPDLLNLHFTLLFCLRKQRSCFWLAGKMTVTS